MQLSLFCKFVHFLNDRVCQVITAPVARPSERGGGKGGGGTSFSGSGADGDYIRVEAVRI